MKKKVLRACDFQQKNEMKLAKVKSFSALLVFLLVIISIASMIAFFIATIGVIAKPVGKNPGTSWPSKTFWGTNLRLENDSYVGQAWFGNTGLLVALAEVEVTILPDPLNPDNIAHVTGVTTLVDPCWSYDPLTYAVKVSNKGVLDDMYELTVTGPSTWGLILTPDEFFVSAGDAEYASLSITLPDNWTGGVSGMATVTAVGMLSRENQNNLYPTDNDNVIVTSGIENNVAKEILPGTFEPQTGAPGSPLVWLVVLKNTGNIVENLSLSLSEALTGVSSASAPRTAWGVTFDQTLFENVAPCTEVYTYLRATIPGDAKTSEWDNITITASDGLGALDIEWVRANVVGPVIPHPSIEVAKMATPTVSKAGDNVVYNIKVTNTGDITLVNITVLDSLLGDLSGSFAGTLTPSASENHDFTYTIKVSDLSPLVNTVNVHANPTEMTNDIIASAEASVTVSENENEPLWVNKGPSTTTTLLSASEITLGESVTDTITVTGLGDPFPVPTGTVEIQVKFDGEPWVTFDIETLVNGTATSIPYVPLQAGQYYFRAIYSGDNNYNGSQSS